MQEEEADEADVAQETFVRVWSRAATFDPKVAQFTTWLHRIALNLAIDRFRRPRGDPIEHAEHVATDEPSALANFDQKERGEGDCTMYHAAAGASARSACAIPFRGA
jgi:RNA polymerase sigma factor (sigma-70 family)